MLNEQRFYLFLCVCACIATWACAAPELLLRRCFSRIVRGPTCVRRGIDFERRETRDSERSSEVLCRTNGRLGKLFVDWLSWWNPWDEWAWPLPASSTQVVRRLQWTVVAEVWSWVTNAALSSHHVVREQRPERQRLSVAIVRSPTAVPRRRRRRAWCRRPWTPCERTDVSKPSQRPRATPGSIASRSDELTLLLPLLHRATVVHVAAYVLC